LRNYARPFFNNITSVIFGSKAIREPAILTITGGGIVGIILLS